MQPTILPIIRCKFGRVASRVRPEHADRDRNFACAVHVDQDSANAEPSAKLSPVFVAGHDKREPDVDVALANPHVWPMVSHLILRAWWRAGKKVIGLFDDDSRFDCQYLDGSFLLVHAER